MEKEQSFKDTETKDKEEASLREEITEMGQALLHADKRKTRRHKRRRNKTRNSVARKGNGRNYQKRNLFKTRKRIQDQPNQNQNGRRQSPQHCGKAS